MYRLTRGWLESKGVDVSAVVLSQVRMYNLGQEVAIGVYDQDGDDAFDAEDYVEFYGSEGAESSEQIRQAQRLLADDLGRERGCR